jgi:hypothetical protein
MSNVHSSKKGAPIDHVSITKFSNINCTSSSSIYTVGLHSSSAHDRSAFRPCTCLPRFVKLDQTNALPRQHFQGFSLASDRHRSCSIQLAFNSVMRMK